MIRPKGNRMLVKPLQKEDEKLGSIIMPGAVHSELEKAKVVRVSEDAEMRDQEGKPFFKENEVILYSSGSGVGQRIGKEFFRWLQSAEVWGIDDGLPDPFITE